jgi:hypothetical protein
VRNPFRLPPGLPQAPLCSHPLSSARAPVSSSGYFEAHLYGTVGLSIHPDRQHIISPEMLSWFPLFFPFKVRNP